MRYGKWPGGIIGVTAKPRSVQIWSESLPTCSEIPNSEKSIQRLKPITKKSQKQEYAPGWKTPKIIRNALELCAHPLDLDSLNNNLLINIYSGEIAHDKCNVQNLVVIGSKELIEFSESLLDGFYATIQKKVVTMEAKGKKNGSFAGNDIYNTEMLYSHVMCLLIVGQILLEDLFFYELSPVP